MELERAYYNHSACHCGWVPLDERLEIGSSEQSPRVQEMVSYLGSFMPFEQAQKFLGKYCSIHVSHDIVNNRTVEIGQALQERQEEAVRCAWEEHRLPSCEVTVPPKCLHVSADGINYLLPDGQGKEIKVAESAQASALGSAMFGAVAAGSQRGGYDTITEAAHKMASVKDETFKPSPDNHRIYQKLYIEYEILHDYFGRGANDCMKRLKQIMADVRSS